MSNTQGLPCILPTDTAFLGGFRNSKNEAFTVTLRLFQDEISQSLDS